MVTCYKCGGAGHISANCPNNRNSSNSRGGPSGGQRGVGHGSRPVNRGMGQSAAAGPPNNHRGASAGESNLNPNDVEVVDKIEFDPNYLANRLGSLTISTIPPPALKKEEEATRKAGREEDRKRNHEKWNRANLNLAVPVPTTNHKKHMGLANFYRVDFLSGSFDVRKYRIDLGKIHDKVPVKREVRRALITRMLQEQPPSLDAKKWVTDYFSHIVSVGKLYANIGDTEGDSLDVPHTRRAPLPNSSSPSEILDTKIVYEGSVQLSKLKDHVTSNVDKLDRQYDPTQDLQSLNILTWSLINSPNWRGGRVGKKFYPAYPMGDRSERDLKWESDDDDPVLLIRTGFFSSMRPGDGSLLLNVNTTTSAFYPDMQLSKYIQNNFRGPKEASGELKGLRVTFEAENGTVLDGTMRSIWAVSGNHVTDVTFVLDKSRITCHRHMITKYATFHKRSNFDEKALAINLGGASPNESWYPADKLRIVPWQPLRKQLPSEFVRAMLDSAEKKPKVNKNLHLVALRELGIAKPQNSIYATFGLKIIDNLLPFKGHSLKSPSVDYGMPKPVETGQAANWALTNILKSKKSEDGGFKVPNTTYTKLLVVKIGKYKDDQYVDDFLFYLKHDLPLYGLITSKDHEIVAVDPPLGDSCYRRRACVTATFKKAYEELQSRNGDGKPALIIFLLPSKNITLYSDVKWWADCVQGVPTVCVTADTIIKAVGKDPKKAKNKPILTRRGRVLDPKVLGNLAMKINFKLGGTNHQIHGSTGLKSRTIVFGADVTHSGKGQDPGCPSLAGVVASSGDGNNTYLASARLQSNNTEFIEELEIMVLERLQRYFFTGSGNKSLPNHILFYRDGVSESQYGMVRDEELPQIQRAAARALAGARSGGTIQITLLVVGKRHHSRFFKNSHDRDPDKNFAPGLCVDSDVVCHNQYSFFLQSHDSPLGTARSGHYVVIENGSGYTPEELHNITNKICFAGSRATNALSVCTPARYADLLCDRLRCYMKPVFDGEMISKLRDNPVSDYCAPEIIWGTTSAKPNPWHSDVSNIMFYL